MRNSFADTFYELAKEDERIYLVVADITAAAGVASFREESPERFINVGVAEQIMIGFAAGLALRGCIPFTYTIAPFTIYRPFEQVRVDCCYQDLPVRLVGVGGGLCYSTLGGTHHAPEDIAIMSSIPNMTVIAPCDPQETRQCTLATKEVAGPLYLRLGKAGEPDLTAEAEPFEFQKIRFIKKGTDACILSYGPITKLSLDVAKRLEDAKGISVAVVSVHCLKPLDKEGIINRVLNKFDNTMIIEESTPHGGLSSRVKELALDSGTSSKIQSFTLQDEFIHTYGSHTELLSAHGLDADKIIPAIKHI